MTYRDKHLIILKMIVLFGIGLFLLYFSRLIYLLFLNGIILSISKLGFLSLINIAFGVFSQIWLGWVLDSRENLKLTEQDVLKIAHVKSYLAVFSIFFLILMILSIVLKKTFV